MMPLENPNYTARSQVLRLAPGLLLCIAVTGAAFWLQTMEVKLTGRAWLEALVIAIILGTALRTLWAPGPAWREGIEFSAKVLLEIAIVLLGATISVSLLKDEGPWLLFGIAAVVSCALLASYSLGRMFGLPREMATLIACGNSICGNSAIAAVAPAIGAEADDVAVSIAFTAVLGVGVVLGLPLLSAALHMTPRAFGIFAGLTVYAVPQVLAATAPVSSISTQIGALVKLVRVLMLGPVVLVLSILESGYRKRSSGPTLDLDTENHPAKARLSVHILIPWFIIGFLSLASIRSFGLLPLFVVAPASQTASGLTIISMAALGLGVDIRSVARAGARVASVVTLSLVALGILSIGLIKLLGLF